jgi:prefoldin subunit 5
MKGFKFFRGTDIELEDLIRELDAIQQRVQEINREGGPVADRVVIDIVDETTETLRQNLHNALFGENEGV